MAATRYFVRPAYAEGEDQPMARKDTAVKEAARRAQRYEEGFEVITSGGKVVHTAEAPVIDIEPADEVPEVQINEDEINDQVAAITGDVDMDAQLASILDTAVAEGSLTAEQRAEIEAADTTTTVEPLEGQPTDTWVATDQADNVLVRVEAPDMDGARKAADTAMGVNGGYALRRLTTVELAELEGQPTEEPPADEPSEPLADEQPAPEAQPEEEAPAEPSTPQAEPTAAPAAPAPAAEGDTHFQIASRLATYLIENLEAGSLLDAIKAAPLVKAGKGQARAVTCNAADAATLRGVLVRLDAALKDGSLVKVKFRTTTLARHMGRIDAALEG